jgi:LemA protein
MAIIILIALIAVLVLWGVGAFNKLVGLRNRVDNGWSQIEVQLQRRFDLIPNLVETVKAYASHETDVFTKVTEARAAAGKAVASHSVADAASAENAYQAARVAINAVSENYPELRSNENFQQLQEELTSTENKVAFARQNYNDTVTAYNTALETVPTNIVARFGTFDHRDVFKVDDEAVRKAPKVSF